MCAAALAEALKVNGQAAPKYIIDQSSDIYGSPVDLYASTVEFELAARDKAGATVGYARCEVTGGRELTVRESVGGKKWS